jgi:hypothetical protein
MALKKLRQLTRDGQIAIVSRQTARPDLPISNYKPWPNEFGLKQ